jgi:hypothetical protein
VPATKIISRREDGLSPADGRRYVRRYLFGDPGIAHRRTNSIDSHLDVMEDPMAQEAPGPGSTLSVHGVDTAAASEERKKLRRSDELHERFDSCYRDGPERRPAGAC